MKLNVMNTSRVLILSSDIRLVIETIGPMKPERKCFRLIGGVLVERSVKDVLPSVKTNMEGINSVIKQLAETYKKKDEGFAAFQKE